MAIIFSFVNSLSFKTCHFRYRSNDKVRGLLKDPKMLKRLQDIDNLPNEDKNGILYALDNLLKAAKLKTL